MGYNAIADNTGLFTRLAVVGSQSAKSRDIAKEFEVIAGHGHPRSSILVSIERAYATSYQSLTISLDVSPAVFEILTFKARKWLVFPPLSCFTPLLGNPLEFPDEA